MFTKENTLLDRFTAGLSALASHIELKNRIRYLDDNITAEQFVCRLMNILYDADYRSGNDTHGLTAGYDLIWEERKEIIQVSSSCTPDKIDDANLKTRRAIREGKLEAGAYNLRFVFLTIDASKLKTCAAARRAGQEQDFSFDPEADILDFTAFAVRVKTEFQFAPERAARLREFMDYCSDVFPTDRTETVPQTGDQVGEIIEAYAKNYEEPLFMHTYTDSRVTLKQLYVAPAFYRYERIPRFQIDGPVEYIAHETRDLKGSLAEYVRNEGYKRERFFFIKGSAAIGKTSLVSWLCWHYRNRTETAKEMLDGRKIICVRLRELEFEGTEKAEQVLLNYLGLPDITALEHRYPEALLVLDGADELSMVRGIPHGSVEAFLLELQRKFRSHKFLITTRPQFLDMEKFRSGSFQYRQIELLHYNEQMRAEWLNRYKACGQTVPENTERYIRSLRGREENGIADTPLALYLLVQCDAESDLLGNQWALYRRIFSEAIVKGEYNANFAESGELLGARDRSVNYRVVQSIAFRIFRNASQERYYLNEQEIMEAISECDLEDLSPQRVRETCVLCAYWKTVGSIGALEFYHNNIRDFFLCEYLCQKLIEGLRDPAPLEKLVPMLCRVLCHADICGSNWKQMYEYLCLRLDFESIKPRTPDSLYHLIQERKRELYMVLPRIAVGPELWNTENLFPVYKIAKQTFRNIHMLVRVLQSFLPEKIELTGREIQTMELLRDWDDMFKTPDVTYTNHRGVTKTIDASSNTAYWFLRMSGRRLEGIGFQLCEICYGDIIRSFLERINFSGSFLKHVDLSKSIFVHGEFYDTEMDDVDVSNVTMIDSFFNGAKLHDVRGAVHLTHCRLYPGTSLVKCGMHESTFDDILVKQVQIENSEFRAACFDRAWIGESSIRNSNFQNTSFDGTIQNTAFEGCCFDYSTFKQPDAFRNVTFQNCSFKYVTFRGMDLSTVTFEDCDFGHTDIFEQ